MRRLLAALLGGATLLALAALLAGAALVAVAAPTQAQAHTVARGLADAVTFDFTDWTDNEAHALHELAAKLNAKYVRFDVYWNQAEPEKGVFAENAEKIGYLDNVVKAVDAADDEGLKVIIVTYRVPKWASNRAFWNDPNLFSRGKDSDGYCNYYAPSADGVAAFGEFGQHLSKLLTGKVAAYEPWNEPNLWVYLYPQTYGGDDAYAVHRYAAMLKAFHDGVAIGDPGALIVGGCTSPIGDPLGTDGRSRTSPQGFAQALVQTDVGGVKATEFFDVYDHHPYTPGGSKDMRPEAAPSDPKTTVQLKNLSTLHSCFPGKPFYLTEYGYNTSTSLVFGGARVSQVEQAAYLKRAYAYAARFDWVKLMCWYQLKDFSPTNKATDDRGIYMGLRTLSGSAKRAWYAFARGNHLTIKAPSGVRYGSTASLTGRLTCATVGGIKGRPLVVQAYRPSTGWRTLKTITTAKDGYYRTSVKPTSTTTYRLTWKGVVTSTTRKVLVL